MPEITLKELHKYLKGYGSAVHCEAAGWYHKGEDSKFFYDRGCAVVTSEYEMNNRQYIYWHVHQVSPEAEIDAVTQECLDKIREHAEKFDNPSLSLASFVVSNSALPPEKDKFTGGAITRAWVQSMLPITVSVHSQPLIVNRSKLHADPLLRTTPLGVNS